MCSAVWPGSDEEQRKFQTIMSVSDWCLDASSSFFFTLLNFTNSKFWNEMWCFYYVDRHFFILQFWTSVDFLISHNSFSAIHKNKPFIFLIEFTRKIKKEQPSPGLGFVVYRVLNSQCTHRQREPQHWASASSSTVRQLNQLRTNFGLSHDFICTISNCHNFHPIRMLPARLMYYYHYLCSRHPWRAC